MRIAIDFDGTITKEPSYPYPRKMRWLARRVINWLYKKHTIIINTCREGKQEDIAKEFLYLTDIHYDYLNENDRQLIDFYGTDTRKISADLYMDDKNFFGSNSFLLLALYVWIKTFKWKRVRPTIIAVVGQSGTGKTTLVDMIEKRMGIPQVQSYTERPRRSPDEKGHTFLSKEEFSSLGYANLLAITNYYGYRYCTLRSDLGRIQTYVVDARGLRDLQRFNGKLWDVYAIYLHRPKGMREGVDKDRINRDKPIHVGDNFDHDIHNVYSEEFLFNSAKRFIEKNVNL